MTACYTEADLAAAWDSGYWNGTSHEGPLNTAAVDAKNPYRQHEEEARGTTPAKACKVSLKTEKGRGAPDQETATASETTND